LENLEIQSPWIIFCKELNALFGRDPDITIQYNQDTNTIKLFVSKIHKAEALSMILPQEKVYGNVTLHIEIVPPNDNLMGFEETFNMAFAGNPCFAFAAGSESPVIGHVDYLVFKPEAAQFFIDDVGELYGNKTMLYQDVAKDVFAEYDPDGKMHICSSRVER
jgi:hypothetical protein